MEKKNLVFIHTGEKGWGLTELWVQQEITSLIYFIFFPQEMESENKDRQMHTHTLKNLVGIKKEYLGLNKKTFKLKMVQRNFGWY